MTPRRAERPATIDVQPVMSTLKGDRPEFAARIGDYFVFITMRRDTERYRVVEVKIGVNETDSPDLEVNSRALRDIELAKFADAARAIVVAHAGWAGTTDAPGPLQIDPAEARRRIRAATRKSSRRAGDRSDAHYRRVALDLVELVESSRPTPDGVLNALTVIEADRLGRPVPVDTLRTWIRVAREREFLAPAVRGRMSAQPGRRLYEIDGDGS